MDQAKNGVPPEVGAAARNTSMERVASLFAQGRSDQEISVETGLKLSTVRVYRCKLRLTRFPARAGCKNVGCKKDPFWRNLDHVRTQMIIHMVKQNASLTEIAMQLSKSEVRAGHILKKLKEVHGAEIFDPGEQWLPTQRAVDALKNGADIIHRLCGPEARPVELSAVDQMKEAARYIKVVNRELKEWVRKRKVYGKKQSP